MSHNLSGFLLRSRHRRCPKHWRCLASRVIPSAGRGDPGGGTDVMVQLGAGQLRPGRYVDIWSIAELRGIRVDEAQIEIGALTTYSEIRKHALLATEFPLLQQSARETGAIAIQNRGISVATSPMFHRLPIRPRRCSSMMPN